MKKFLGAILVAGIAVLGGGQVAQAGGATDAALGLGAFAAFNQFVHGETILHSLFRPAAPVVVQPPVIVATPPPVVYAPPPPPVVYYAPPRPVVYAPVPAPVYYAPKHVYRRIPPGHYRKYYGHHH